MEIELNRLPDSQTDKGKRNEEKMTDGRLDRWKDWPNEFLRKSDASSRVADFVERGTPTAEAEDVRDDDEDSPGHAGLGR